MDMFCTCGERIITTGGNLNQTEVWGWAGYERVLIYAVCAHGKVVVDNRPKDERLKDGNR